MAQKQTQAEQRAQEQRAFSEHISSVLQAVKHEQVRCSAQLVPLRFSPLSTKVPPG